MRRHATTSSLNFMAGETVANRDIVNVGTGGQIEVYNFAGNGQRGRRRRRLLRRHAVRRSLPLAAPVRVTDTRSTDLNGTQHRLGRY